MSDVVDKKRGALVPKLRFPEFATIDNWTLRRFGSIYKFQRTNTLSRNQLSYHRGLIKNIHYGDIHTKFSTLVDATKEEIPYVNDGVTLKLTDDDYCKPSDVIFADASEDLEDIGKSIEIIRISHVKLISGTHTLLARQRADTFVIGFAGYLFRSLGVRTKIQREAQGTKVLGVSRSRLSEIVIAYPESKAEQQKIANCLTSLDNLIATSDARIVALKTHKQGLLQWLFPRDGATVPRLRFAEFNDADKWNLHKLEELAQRGSGHTPNKQHPEYYNGGIKWISLADSKNLDNGYIFQTDKEISEEGIHHSSAVLHPAGTVILSRDAGVGRSAIMFSPMAVSQHFMAWRCIKSKLNNWFLYYTLQKLKSKFESIAVGNTIKTIGLAYFKALKISTPSVAEQQKIADCLSSLDDLIAATTARRDALREHKKGLMQQLFPSVNELAP